MALQLYPHNQIAYDAAMDMIRREGKAAVIHPTGTGKSFIAFQLALSHPNEAVLWLSPSEYIYQAQKKGLASAMLKFRQEMLSNVTFLTYAKLIVSEGEWEALKPDWIIFDEFHRAGSKEWGKGVRKLLGRYKKAGLLGLSATKIRYLDHQRDMAMELFDGHIASEMSLGQAIAAGILPAPTYVTSMYSFGQELNHLKKQIQASGNPRIRGVNEKLLEKLRRELERAEGLDQTFARHMKNPRGKYLVFCSGREQMQEIMQKAQVWFSKVDAAPHMYCMTYDDARAAKMYADFLEDDSDHLKLMFSIDMLNEGVHIKGVDGVILMRPTVSPILYLQQIGRALAAGSKAEPVIFDIVNNFESLHTIDSMSQELREEMCLRLNENGRREAYGRPFQIIDKMRDCRVIFEQIRKNLMAGWDAYFEAAREYFEENGNLKIPKPYVTKDGLALGAWLLTQKRIYAQKLPGSLTEGQIQRLEQIGMDWSASKSQSFERGIQALASYHSEWGNADVKSSYVSKDGYPLGKWVSNIRRKYKAASGSRLTEEQIQRLDALGMIWDKTEYRWNENYEAAKQYFMRHGNLKVSRDYLTEDGRMLGVWLDKQRAAYLGKGRDAAPLTDGQVSKLESIGMVWEKRNEGQWNDRYRCAERYFKKHGNLKIPVTYVTEDGRLLGKWVNRQREKFKNQTLSKERRERLIRIGLDCGKKEFETAMNQDSKS